VGGPPGPTPGYALALDLKKCFLTEKNQASYAGFAQSYRNYAGNQKKLIITDFLVKFCCFIQNYDLNNWNFASSKIRILRSFWSIKVLRLFWSWDRNFSNP